MSKPIADVLDAVIGDLPSLAVDEATRHIQAGRPVLSWRDGMLEMDTSDEAEQRSEFDVILTGSWLRRKSIMDAPLVTMAQPTTTVEGRSKSDKAKVRKGQKPSLTRRTKTS